MGQKLSLDFFICHQCQSKALLPRLSRASGKSNLLPSIRYQSTTVNSTALPRADASPLISLSQKLSNAEKTASKKFFPETSSRSVAYWLLGSAASVFGIVVFGGLTRLTESGYVIAHG
jgi:heme a synthase